MSRIVRKAVIPCGGLGTRFLPATKIVPKEVFPLVDKPGLLYILEECYDSGIEDVLLLSSERKGEVFNKFIVTDEKVEAEIEKSGRMNDLRKIDDIVKSIKISQVFDKEDFAGTGIVTLGAEEWADGEPFVLIYGDDLCYAAPGMRTATGQLIDMYRQMDDDKLVVGSQRVNMDVIHKFSSCMIGKEVAKSGYELFRMIEKPTREEAPSNLAGMARYVLPNRIFDYIRKTPKDVRGQVCVTDSMDLMAREEGAYTCIFDAKRYDLGDKLGYLIATVEYALRDKELGDSFVKYLKTLELD